jgi:hypothetical protein
VALTDGLVEFWTLNNTLTGINGNTLVSPDGLTHYVAGKIGQAWDVANTSTRILRQLPGPINPGSDSKWSLSYWIHVTDPEAIDTSYNWSIYDGTTVKAYVRFFNPDGITVKVDSLFMELVIASRIQAGWNHIAITADVAATNILRAWVNGEPDPEGGATGCALPNMTVPNFYLGGNNATGPWGGLIDAFGFWNRLLTNSEIADLYAAGAGWEPAVTSVVTQILWGSTPDQSRILNSRIVRGLV